MGIGRTCASADASADSSRRCPRSWRQAGTSLVEVSLVMGLLGLLGCIGIARLDFGSAQLASVTTELQGSIHQAQTLARACGRDVKVAIGGHAATQVIPVHLPPKVKWGKLPQVPMPPGMAETVQAGQSGESHHQITVTPRHTVTAAAWFLNDGREVICMRLNGQGQMKLLRWSRYTRSWWRV